MWKDFFNAIRKQPKKLFHAVTKTTLRRIDMQSVKRFMELYCSKTRLDFGSYGFIDQT